MDIQKKSGFQKFISLGRNWNFLNESDCLKSKYSPSLTIYQKKLVNEKEEISFTNKIHKTSSPITFFWKTEDYNQIQKVLGLFPIKVGFSHTKIRYLDMEPYRPMDK